MQVDGVSLIFIFKFRNLIFFSFILIVFSLFFCNKKLVGIYDYWEEGEYNLSKPDTTEFEEIAKQIESNFFSMDIARQKNGELIIIELGDGQVAGLPDKTNRCQMA